MFITVVIFKTFVIYIDLQFSPALLRQPYPHDNCRDDHEVTNNWWPGRVLGLPLYPNNTSVNLLATNALRAFYEYNPIMKDQLIYRKQKFGKHLEIFFVDMRSYRDPNPLASNNSKVAIMGVAHMTWLLDALKASTATWKVLSMDDPIGIITGGYVLSFPCSSGKKS
jgi:alkaline phosphatase D